MNELSFHISSENGSLAFIPEIDSVPLTDLVLEFERRQDWQPAGGYSGLIPANYNYGQINIYLLGKNNRSGLSNSGKIALLGCNCGEVGCWPLLARVVAEESLVKWTDFEQPYRRGWDYGNFGPFHFPRQQYDRALTSLLTSLEGGVGVL